MTEEQKKTRHELIMDSVNESELAEGLAWNLLVHEKWVTNVVDVRDDKHFREKDIDFIVIDNNRQAHFLDVKADFLMYKTGNLCYERDSYDGQRNRGCFETSEAEWFLYIDIVQKKYYMVLVKRLREWVHKNEKSIIDCGWEKKCGDCGVGYLLPIAKLIEFNLVKELRRN